MAKFKIGDKVVVIDERSTNMDYYNGDVGIITKFDTPASKACFVEREADGLSMNVYFSEIEHLREKEMNAEQIRDEILRIDVCIEEAKKDIENVEKERNSLVEKLREKGFTLLHSESPALVNKGRPTEGDTVRVRIKDHHARCFGYTFVIARDDGTGIPYCDKDGEWYAEESVEKI